MLGVIIARRTGTSALADAVEPGVSTVQRAGTAFDLVEESGLVWPSFDRTTAI
jgi:hypothetical protein